MLSAVFSVDSQNFKLLNMSKIKEFFKVLFCSHYYRVAKYDYRFLQCLKCKKIK